MAQERADGPKAVVVGHGVSVHRELQDTWAQKQVLYTSTYTTYKETNKTTWLIDETKQEHSILCTFRPSSIRRTLATLGKLLRDRVERVWAFPSA